MNLRLFNLLLILLLATTTGCATYALHTHDFRTQLAGGHFEQALSSLKGVDKKTNRLLYHMENGLVEHYRGQFQASNKHFETAERLSDRLFTRSLSKEIASFVTNDAVRSYRQSVRVARRYADNVRGPRALRLELAAALLLAQKPVEAREQLDGITPSAIELRALPARAGEALFSAGLLRRP